ncbi:MAG: hypothetical protein ABW277_19770 [Longimicrobiaceae bacterium]
MALRTLLHGDTEWLAWDVHPSPKGRIKIAIATAAGLEEGWLCFESAGEKRRVAPIPHGWEEWPDDHLAQCIAGAEVVRRPGAQEVPGSTAPESS